MSLWEQLAGCHVEIEGYELEGLSAVGLQRLRAQSTVIRLRGAGLEGVGEDVTYEAEDHDILQAAGPTLPLAGSFTLAELLRAARRARAVPASRRSARSRGGTAPGHTSPAALDLALRQAGTRCTTPSAASPRRCASSSRCGLGEPPSLDPMRLRIELYPEPALQARPDELWDGELIAALVETRGRRLRRLQGLLQRHDRRPAG